MKAISKEDKSKQYKKTIKNHNKKSKKKKKYIYIGQLLKRAHCLLSKLILNDSIQSNLAKLLGYRKKEQQQKNSLYGHTGKKTRQHLRNKRIRLASGILKAAYFATIGVNMKENVNQGSYV